MYIDILQISFIHFLQLFYFNLYHKLLHTHPLQKEFSEMTWAMFINCYCMVEIGILKQLQGRISAFLIRYYFIIIQNVSVICFYFVFMHNFINKTCILLLANTSAWFVNYLQVVGWSLIFIFLFTSHLFYYQLFLSANFVSR